MLLYALHQDQGSRMEQTLGQRLEELVWTYSSMARMHVVHKDLAGTELEKIAEKLDVRCTLLSRP